MEIVMAIAIVVAFCAGWLFGHLRPLRFLIKKCSEAEKSYRDATAKFGEAESLFRRAEAMFWRASAGEPSTRGNLVPPPGGTNPRARR